MLGITTGGGRSCCEARGLSSDGVASRDGGWGLGVDVLKAALFLFAFSERQPTAAKGSSQQGYVAFWCEARVMWYL